MYRDNRIAAGALKRALLGGAAAALLASAAMAQETAVSFDIAAQEAGPALNDFSRQSGLRVLFPYDAVEGKRAPAVRGEMTPQAALDALLGATGLIIARNDGRTVTLTDPQSESAGGGADANAVDALIVTAQKREEDIQDVPIAISAFSQEDLTTRQVAGGPDLMTQVPNFTFTKTNFTGYSIQIRGIGTQAISATTDPAVAVAFNNTPFIRNHFFEQEFYDLQRVEVLRGPQGTLYGRNATAGVVNILSAKPTYEFKAKLAGDVANYKSRRLEGMLNIPLVEDKAALRIAGAWTKRDGFVKNILTGEQTDGRDLWSVRATLAIEPTDWLSVHLIYEHFEEQDDRLRTGKQLCRKDPGPTVGDEPAPPDVAQAFSQGCLPASLYSPDAYQTPNGFALPYYGPAADLGSPVHDNFDPYVSTTQSRDLREIETHLIPEYEAANDVVELQLQFDLSPTLTLMSETGFNRDYLFSFEDFNRFDTQPGVFIPGGKDGAVDDDGVFCDPQLGCSNRLAVGDLATANSQQFSQEFRLSSDFEGRFNFNLGGNFLRYDTEDKYYVFANSLTAFAYFNGPGAAPWVAGVTDNAQCFETGFVGNSAATATGYTSSDPNQLYTVFGCKYVDPNDIHNLNDMGRQYFVSKNPYKLISYSMFGETYYSITPNLKLTTGFRWTVDRKTAPQIPSWLISVDTFGTPTRKVIEQEWSEPTGRIALDWKPELSFTDETLVYASYVHGYKAGGANPPPPVLVGLFADGTGFEDDLVAESLTHPETFDAEFVDAFEVGTKNTLADGALTLNLNAFYYDYRGYQISQIVDRSAVNLNFDATVWGAEIEADWRPLENLRLGFKGGYENTRLAEGSRAIDLMDRTAGNPDWILIKPFPTYPSNCIVPAWFVDRGIAGGIFGGAGVADGTCLTAYKVHVDPVTGLPYVPNPTLERAQGSSGGTQPLDPRWVDYPGFDPASAPNNGEGFAKDLSGNELPNAPRFTATLTADYTLPLPNDWLMTLHSDFYYQAEAWTRVFNMEGYDKLKAYTNVNLAAIFNNDGSGLQVMAYVKNAFDRDSITGAFLNSDDTGLTTNVFLTEPRLYGVRVTKNWAGGPAWAGAKHVSGEPYLFTLELGANPESLAAGNEVYAPDWLETFRPSAGFPLSPQDEDLDWGDGREARLTYAPGGLKGWRLSAGVRYGKANGGGRGEVSENAPDSCLKYNEFCGPGPLNTGTTKVNDREDYLLADFMVGREVGLGVLGREGSSSVAAGVRYAAFNSLTVLEMHSNPDRYLPPQNAAQYDIHWHHYDVDFHADRGFSGLGPEVSWEASSRLLGGGEAGRVDLDWGLSGGVIFGKQKADVRAATTGVYDQGTAATRHSDPIDDLAQRQETKSVSVPNFGASLGLSYSLERLKIAAGYRWDRYYDAIDGGVSERRSYDRTIDGPYFRISVGLGR